MAGGALSLATVSTPLPLPQWRARWKIFCSLSLLAQKSAVPKFSKKEQPHTETQTSQCGVFQRRKASSPATDEFQSGFMERGQCSSTPTATRTGFTASRHGRQCSMSPAYRKYVKDSAMSFNSPGTRPGSMASFLPWWQERKHVLLAEIVVLLAKDAI